MRQLAIVLMLVTAATGCGAAKSALGALGGGKPTQVTVVNHIEPQSVVVNVAAPVVPAPVLIVQPAAAPTEKHARLKAAATGAFAGALVGGVVGYAVDGRSGLGKGAAVGAGAGAVAGAATN